MRISDWSSDVCSSDLTIKPLSLKGNGVLGKKVKYVSGDSQTNPDAARQAAQRAIERDGAIMFSGGPSSAVAVAQQYLAQDKGVIFMDALTHSNDTSGKHRRRYGFRHFRSEEHTCELQSLMRTSYAVFCLKQKPRTHTKTT